MNTKRVQKVFDEVLSQYYKMPSEDFKKLLKEKSKGDIGNILLEGGFIGSRNKNISDEELLQAFPSLEVSQSKSCDFELPASYKASFHNISNEVSSYHYTFNDDFIVVYQEIESDRIEEIDVMEYECQWAEAV